MLNNENNNPQEEKLNLNLFLGIAIISILIILGSVIGNFGNKPLSNEISTWGTFGDFIGGTLNPILAFLSLIALLYTIKIQSKELALSTKELHEAQKATRDSATALEEQSKSIKLQNFENTFFSMLDLHNKIVDNIKVKKGLTLNNRFPTVFNGSHDMESIQGRDAIKDIYTKTDNYMKSNIHQMMRFNKSYDTAHEAYQSYIGHYFGNIYQILKFISKSNEIEDKRKYSDLFRAQFSSEELKLLFYHCSGEIGSKKFKNYIEEFEFFEHLPIEKNNRNYELILLRDFYDLKAFGKNTKKIEDFKIEKNKSFFNHLETKHETVESLKEIAIACFKRKMYKESISFINEIKKHPKKHLITLKMIY